MSGEQVVKATLNRSSNVFLAGELELRTSFMLVTFAQLGG